MTAARYMRQLLFHVAVTGEPDRCDPCGDAWALENILYSPVTGAVEEAWEAFLDRVDALDGPASPRSGFWNPGPVCHPAPRKTDFNAAL